MGAFGHAIGAMLKRPFIIIFLSIFALVYSIFEYFVPVLNTIVLMNTTIRGDILLAAFAVIQGILKLTVTYKGFIVITIAVVVLSLIIALILSGYFNIINNVLDRKPKQKGEMAEGISKNFFKMWFMSFACLAVGIVFCLVLMIAFIPSLVITEGAVMGKNGYFIAAVFVDFITIGAAFFGIMFLRIYLVFWFPSVLINDKKVFTKGRQLVDTYFWSLSVKFLLLDMVFICFQMLAIKYGNLLVFIPIKWIFTTLYFAFFITYTFSLFKTYTIKIHRKSQKQID